MSDDIAEDEVRGDRRNLTEPRLEDFGQALTNGFTHSGRAFLRLASRFHVWHIEFDA